MKRVSIAQAKNELPALIREVEGGESIALTRHGRTAAVLVSEAEYRRAAERLVAIDPWQAIVGWRRDQVEGVELTGKEVDGWRVRDAGRPVEELA